MRISDWSSDVCSSDLANIFGANDRIKVGVMGVNSRGNALATNFALQKNCQVLYISDVDTRAADKCAANVEKNQGKRPKLAPDFRKALEDKDLDAMAIATPDHWHARSEEQTYELQLLMRSSSDVFCLKKK